MLKKYIPKPVKNFLKRVISCATWDQWANRSWSQEGEDQILRRLFERQLTGFYVDVGAHHPMRFSNTYLFHKRGWKGINIDAMPGSMESFHRHRPRDLNLELGIAAEEQLLDYFVFNEPALNGFSKQLSENRSDGSTNYKIQEVIKVKVLPLSSVLDRHLPPGQRIDFMSIDVEGLDLEVLRSNDWSNYRPSFVLAEVLGSNLHEIEQSELGRFMINVGYLVYAKCVNTVFFMKMNQE